MILLQVLALTALTGNVTLPTMNTYQFHTMQDCQNFRGNLVVQFSINKIPNYTSLCQQSK